MKREGSAFAVVVAASAAALLLATLRLGAGSRLAPLVVVLPTFALALVEAVRTVRRTRGGGPPARPPGRGVRLFAWGSGLVGLLWLVGFWATVPVFLVPWLRAEAGFGWGRALWVGGATSAAFFLVFGVLVRAPFPAGILLR